MLGVLGKEALLTGRVSVWNDGKVLKLKSGDDHDNVVNVLNAIEFYI